MKRLLFAYLYCNYGGVTSVLKRRMPALRASGWAVDAIFQADYGGREDLEAAGVEEIVIAGAEFAPAIARQLAAKRYDVVALVDAPELIAPVRQLFSGRLVYEIHTSIARVLARIAPPDLETCSLVLVPSRWSKGWVAAHFPRLDPARIEVCANIIPEQEFAAAAADASAVAGSPELLWVGKLDGLKNWRDAARTAGLVAGRHEVRLTMVTGGGVDKARAEALLTEWAADGIERRARWLHNLPLGAMAALYRKAAHSGGVLLSTSLSESFGMVLHEALRSGLPVVATAVGACPEVIRDGTSGFLFEPGADHEAAARVGALLEDRSLRVRLAEGAREVLAAYDEAVLARRYLGLLEAEAAA